jgi:hypothetical protein
MGILKYISKDLTPRRYTQSFLRKQKLIKLPSVNKTLKEFPEMSLSLTEGNELLRKKKFHFWIHPLALSTI